MMRFVLCWPWLVMALGLLAMPVLADDPVDWYTDSQAHRQARQHLERLVQEMHLAQLHPRFTQLTQRLNQVARPSNALYTEVFRTLLAFRHHWDDSSFEQRQRLEFGNGWLQPLPPLPAQAWQEVDTLAPPLAEYPAVSARVQALLALPELPRPIHIPPLTLGQAHPQLALVQQRLMQLGDAPTPLVARRWDSVTLQALQHFQRRHALTPDGILGPKTLAALNLPHRQRIKALLRTLWRRDIVRFLTDRPAVLVNVPDYRLSVIENGQEALVSRVIVGTAARPTPLFSSRLTAVVLNPHWHVPPTILQEDILPKVQRNPNYLAEQGYTTLDRQGNEVILAPEDLAVRIRLGFPYQLRLGNVPHNPLGRYKFYLPNDEAIYLHGTPAQHLFAQDDRDLSSGCIRVEEAEALAQYALGRLAMPEHRWREWQTTTANKWLPLADYALDYYSVYWRSWLDETGQVQWREDIYQQD